MAKCPQQIHLSLAACCCYLLLLCSFYGPVEAIQRAAGGVDYCQSKPCQHGGMCSSGETTYTCYCLDTDYDGPNCNSWINDCQPSPCQNGGKCTDGLRSYTCDCSGTDFHGTNCQYRIDDCMPNRCQNGAPCTDRFRNYTCNCYDGFSGRDCSVDYEDCTPHLCKNEGRCLEISNQKYYGLENYPPPFNGTFEYSMAAGYVCWCPQGAYGTHCENNPNDCLIPGTNQSMCVHASSCTDGLASFTCHCLPGYEGPTCSQEIDECRALPPPCPSGATCIDRLADFECANCPARLSGRKCSVQLTGCDSSPCQNNSTCEPILVQELPTPVHNYQCICSLEQNFAGRNCSVKLPSFSFGLNGDASSASFTSLPSISNVAANNSWTIELRLVTLSSDTFLMMLGDPSDSATTPRLLVTIDPFGRLFAQLLHSNGSQIAALTSSDSVATGSFVSVKMSVSISGRELSLAAASAVRSASLSSASPLSQLSGQLIIGGFSGAPAAPAPPPVAGVTGGGRSRRSAPAIPSRVTSVLPPNITAFRGIFSFVRLNGDKPLILGPVPSSLIDSLPDAVVASHSTAVVADNTTENVCQTFSPCKNGAACTNIFYNSYSCNCTVGWLGVNCTVIDHCYFANEYCPNGSECVTLHPSGFECRAAATFGSSLQSPPTSQLHIVTNGLNEPLETVSGWARTRQSNCQLLSVSSGSHRLTLDCNSGQLQASIDDQTSLVAVPIATGLPFTFKINCAEGRHLTLSVSINGSDSTMSSSKSVISTALTINTYAIVIVGGVKFKGCLDDVRLNGYLAPLAHRFLAAGSSGFERPSAPTPLIGCHGDPVCQNTNEASSSSACLNGGQCSDLWNDFSCNCSTGFLGKTCADTEGSSSAGFPTTIVIGVSAALLVVILVAIVFVIVHASRHGKSQPAAQTDTPLDSPRPRRLPIPPPTGVESHPNSGYLAADVRNPSANYTYDDPEALELQKRPPNETAGSVSYIRLQDEAGSQEVTPPRALPAIPSDEGIYLSDELPPNQLPGNNLADQPYSPMAVNRTHIAKKDTVAAAEGQNENINTYDEAIS